MDQTRRMALRIVTPTNDDEWRPFDQVIDASFGAAWEESKPEDLERMAIEAPFGFRIGVMDGETVLGGCASYEFDLHLPGGCPVPVAGLSGVGGNVATQGRGLLKALMKEHLDRARARGHAASVLNASEARLYKRFGYGHATTMVGYEVDSGRAQLSESLDDPGSIELVHELIAALPLFKTAYEAAALVVPGTGSRNELWWERVLGTTPSWRGGGKQLAAVHRSSEGDPDGYVLYEVKDTPAWVSKMELTIRELVAASVTTELALFQFATQVPLQRKVLWPDGPIDFVARHHLADPRQLRVVDQHDLLWLRPLNVVELLESRTYSADVETVIAVDDDLYDDQRGPWQLSISKGIATVTATDAPPAVTLTPSQLGMILLGEHRVQELVFAGHLLGDATTLATLDHAFLTHRRPYNLSKF